MNCKRCEAPLSGRKTVFCSKRCKNQQAAVDWRRKLKHKMVLFLGGKCQRCGYDKCDAALTFHHRDPTQKEFSFGAVRWRAWSVMAKELAKCDLLCVCCHAELHWVLDGNTL